MTDQKRSDENNLGGEGQSTDKSPKNAPEKSSEAQSTASSDLSTLSAANLNIGESVLDPTLPSSSSSSTSNVPGRRRNKRFYTVGVLISALVLGSTGGVLYFRSKEVKEVVKEEVESTAYKEVEEKNEKEIDSKRAGVVVEEAKEQLEKSEISLDILNGSDVSGLAGDTADTFRELGYEIVEIGNAESTEGNQLYVNPSAQGKVEALLEDVKEELGISTIFGDLEDSSSSARIILGE